MTMTTDNYLVRLSAELAAIEHWDRDYFQRENHDREEVSAYESRKRRRTEIMQQMELSDPAR